MCVAFPSEFIWGVGNSAPQSEGAWNLDGKGESIWDRFSHVPGNILNGDTCDVTSDFYHRYESDIDLLDSLGFRHFRMSIAWTRIIPDGDGEVNQEGIDFYHRVFDKLAVKGITPLVNIYWWDLPQALQDKGGWTNQKTVDAFERYAGVVFKEYGAKVSNWLTLDEPFCGAFIGHWLGTQAPGLRDFSAALLASYNILLAHGRAVRLCRKKCPQARIGIALNLSDCKPGKVGQIHEEAALRADGYRNRWFLDPLFRGKFPQDMLDWFEAKGVVLPEIDGGDLAIMSTPIDFLGINFYSPHFYVDSPQTWPFGFAAVQVGYPINDIGWEIVPEALYNILKRIRRDYGDVECVITANGNCVTDIPNRNGEIVDDGRIDYMYNHLIQLHRALEEGINVSGYYAFSFMDNFEWALGFTKRFGLVYVDFKTQQRIVKHSGLWFARFVQTGNLAVTGE